MPLGGDSEEVGGYRGGGPPLEMRGLSHMLGVPALGSNTRKTSLLSWLESQWDYQEDCKKPRLHSGRACTHLLTPGNKAEKVD